LTFKHIFFWKIIFQNTCPPNLPTSNFTSCYSDEHCQIDFGQGLDQNASCCFDIGKTKFWIPCWEAGLQNFKSWLHFSYWLCTFLTIIKTKMTWNIRMNINRAVNLRHQLAAQGCDWLKNWSRINSKKLHEK